MTRSKRQRLAWIPRIENLEKRVVLGFVWNAPVDEWPVPTFPTCCPGSPGVSTTRYTLDKLHSSQTSAPVRHYDGTPVIFTDDLGGALTPFGLKWGQTRSWSGLNNSSLNGNGWSIDEIPYIIVTGTVNEGGAPGASLGTGYLSGTENDLRISVVAGGTTAFTFQVPTSSPYTSYAPWGDQQIRLGLTPDPTPALRLTDAEGNIMEFYDVRRDSNNKPVTGSMSADLSSKYGKLKSYTSADGTVGIVTDYGTNGYLTSLTVADSTAGAVERLLYSYSTVTNDLVASASATPPELLQAVTLQRPNGSGGWSSIRRSSYTYYTGRSWSGTAWTNDPNGRLGDLKLAEVQTPGSSGATWDTIDTKYYRYYKFTGESFDGGSQGPTNHSATTGGPAPLKPRGDMAYNPASPNILDAKVSSGLKTVVEGASFARLAASLPDYAAASDNDIKPYVDHYFKYERWADHVGSDGITWMGSDFWNNNDNHEFRIGYRISTRYRVIEEVAQAAGCSACTGGMGTYGYQYTTNYSTSGMGYNSIEYNTWRMKTTEYLPDNSTTRADNDQNITYTNEVGQPLLSILADLDTQVVSISSINNFSVSSISPIWRVTAANHGFQTGDRVALTGILPEFVNGIFTVTRINSNTFEFQIPATYYRTFPGMVRINQTVNSIYVPTTATKVLSEQITSYNRYDDQGRLTMQADNSAISGYDDAYLDLLHNVSGNYAYLKNSSGVVNTYEYYSSTTATASATGGVEGLLKAVYVQQGEAGTPIIQRLDTYYAHTANGITVPQIAAETVYGLDSGTNSDFTDREPRTTSYAYTWFSGTNRVQSVTVTEPTVSSTQNGPGSADNSSTVFDIHGRAIWHKDQAGFLQYTAYDTVSGAVIKRITDVNTSQTSDFSSLPSGWSTPSGGGLHLIDTWQVDAQGRQVLWVNPRGDSTWTVYNDASHEVRLYHGWNSTSHTAVGPTEVYREYRPASGASSGQRYVYFETLTTSATPTYNSSTNAPTGQETISQSNIQSLDRRITNSGGQVVADLLYFSLAGVTYASATAYLGSSSNDSSSGNYHATAYGYDDRGRQNRVVTASGTIYRTVYDALDRVISQWVGTNDTGATHANPAGSGSPNNMFKTTSYEYDNGGVGDNNLTRVVLYPDSNTSNQRVTDLAYDWRDRLVATKDGVESSESTSVNRPITFRKLNNLGQTTSISVFDGDGVTLGVSAPSSSLRKAYVEYAYDAQGRVYQQSQYSVNQSAGTLSTYALTTNTWYDRRGYAIKTAAPGGLVTKSTIDGAGRLSARYFNDGGGDSAWSDADDVSGDIVLNQQEFTYDAAGNLIFVVNRDRFHDNGSGDTGVLGTPTTGNKARVSYQALYYDKANRVTDSVNVGTNGGSAYTRPGSAPSRSNTVLVNSYGYDASGRPETVTDPRGVVAKTYHDLAGRVTRTIDAYTSGTPTASTDRTVEYTYNGLGDVLTVKAVLPSSAFQTTAYIYATTPTVGGTFYSNDVLSETRHPDKSTGSASSSEKETIGQNTLGELVTATDRNGTVHNYAYNVLGRLTSDKATTLGTGIDGAVRRLETTYDTLGQPLSLTSYDATSGGNVVNQVVRSYKGLSQVTAEYQSHSGAVNTSTTPKVQYAYSEMTGGANHSRLTQLVYPQGATVNYSYGSGLDSAISRITSAEMLSTGNATLSSESYSYLGLGQVVVKSTPVANLSYIQATGDTSANTDAGDKYTGLDRFGRVIDQVWRNSSGSVIDRYQYGYDRSGNRLFKNNLLDTALSELYGYDNLNQTTSFSRGVLSDANSDGLFDTVASPSRTQAWNLDALGNWSTFTTNSTSQSRSHNAQNQLTAVGSTTLSYDANGSMTADESGRVFVYDAWNRLVSVRNTINSPIVGYSYDALGRRIIEDRPNANTVDHLYYSTAWQVLEERRDGAADSNIRRQYFWSIDYVDALTAQVDYASGAVSASYQAQYDANWNVTAIANASTGVLERYIYDPYGAATVLYANWSARGGSPYGWNYLHQGGRFDVDSNLYHFRHRDYSAPLGRWTQTDPIGFDAGDLNLYRYVGNSPGYAVDPGGLEPASGPEDDFINRRLPGEPISAKDTNRVHLNCSTGQVGSINTDSAINQSIDTGLRLPEEIVIDLRDRAIDRLTGGILDEVGDGLGVIKRKGLPSPPIRKSLPAPKKWPSISDDLKGFPSKPGKGGVESIWTLPDEVTFDRLYDNWINGCQATNPGQKYKGVGWSRPDGVIIRRRPYSKSEGPAMDITLPGGSSIRIHIK